MSERIKSGDVVWQLPDQEFEEYLKTMRKYAEENNAELPPQDLGAGASFTVDDLIINSSSPFGNLACFCGRSSNWPIRSLVKIGEPVMLIDRSGGWPGAASAVGKVFDFLGYERTDEDFGVMLLVGTKGYNPKFTWPARAMVLASSEKLTKQMDSGDIGQQLPKSPQEGVPIDVYQEIRNFVDQTLGKEKIENSFRACKGFDMQIMVNAEKIIYWVNVHDFGHDEIWYPIASAIRDQAINTFICLLSGSLQCVNEKKSTSVTAELTEEQKRFTKEVEATKIDHAENVAKRAAEIVAEQQASKSWVQLLYEDRIANRNRDCPELVERIDYDEDGNPSESRMVPAIKAEPTTPGVNAYMTNSDLRHGDEISKIQIEMEGIGEKIFSLAERRRYLRGELRRLRRGEREELPF